MKVSAEEKKHFFELIDKMCLYSQMAAEFQELEKQKLEEAYLAIKEAENGA